MPKVGNKQPGGHKTVMIVLVFLCMVRAIRDSAPAPQPVEFIKLFHQEMDPVLCGMGMLVPLFTIWLSSFVRIKKQTYSLSMTVMWQMLQAHPPADWANFLLTPEVHGLNRLSIVLVFYHECGVAIV